MGYRIDSKHARRQLDSRTSAYWKQIDPGFSIGYRKNKNTGTWFARRYLSGEYTIRRLGAADDNQPANGIDVLSFKQARKKGSDYEDILVGQGCQPLAALPYQYITQIVTQIHFRHKKATRKQPLIRINSFIINSI